VKPDGRGALARAAAIWGAAALAGAAGCRTVQARSGNEARVGASVGAGFTIAAGKVGPVRLGEPLPKELLGDGAALRYFARYVADGRVFEGFALENPALEAGIAGGPLSRHVKIHGVVEPPVDSLREAGVKAARQGARVDGIVIRNADLRTESGLGVGSTLAEIEAAHGKAARLPAPPTFGDDLCNVRVEALPGVSFVFASCAAAESGAPAIRVDLWSEAP
jgi:hypothetical protein